jgi:hypothetical protein
VSEDVRGPVDMLNCNIWLFRYRLYNLLWVFTDCSRSYRRIQVGSRQVILAAHGHL